MRAARFRQASVREAFLRHAHVRNALAGFGLALSLGLATPAMAQQRPYLLWLDGAKLDVAQIIGLPPAQNSPEAKAEFEQVQQITLNRTPEREKQAIADQRQGLVNFLNGMDTNYVDNTHREVRLLFREAQVELSILLKSVHRLTNRQRPFQLWAKTRVKPCPGARPEGTSFPSGHAATAALYAELLKAAVPSMADKLEERVRSYSESRLICGFHFQSDLVAGDKVGRAVAKALLADRAFRVRFDETIPEIKVAFGVK
ncbi:Phosphatase PAP2 family protein [Hyphomicrobiales bacterium]|nr:Phosphatase PAP2 family protein [Hyphomicrobiales bacterium]CAH1700295.1 Phosphatase PAP2 family protein [Hyphomicrobiales bacterium]CAI0344073.1 acid phosphatase (class A) [Hyphomicrobiales bacterium]